MAIFNVNESSLSEYLNETSARTKYVRMQKEKADKYDKEKSKIKDLAFRSYSNDPTSQAAYKKWEKLNNKSKEAFKQAAKYTTGEDGSNGNSWMRYQDPKSAPSGGIHIKGEKYSLHQKDRKPELIKKDGEYKVKPGASKPDYAGLAASLKGKEQFNKDFSGKGNKDPYEKDKVAYDDKYSKGLSKENKKWRLDRNKEVIKERLKAKGKLKEAAEYIYSMIESAEYYENHDEVNTSLREAAEYILAVLDESEKK